MRFLVGLLSAAAVITVAPAASATVIIAGSGWQHDQVGSANAISSGSPWTFTVTGLATFSLSDAFIVGDVYQLFDSVTSTLLATSAFTAGAATDVQAGATGPGGSTYGPLWTNATYSRLVYTVGPGTYSFNVTGDGAGGFPAGFGVRLDLMSAVPEPTTWAVMILGFGMTGVAIRGRRRAIV